VNVDTAISSEHARVEFEPATGQFFICDGTAAKPSTNGTWYRSVIDINFAQLIGCTRMFAVHRAYVRRFPQVKAADFLITHSFCAMHQHVATNITPSYLLHTFRRLSGPHQESPPHALSAGVEVLIGTVRFQVRTLFALCCVGCGMIFFDKDFAVGVVFVRLFVCGCLC